MIISVGFLMVIGMAALLVLNIVAGLIFAIVGGIFLSTHYRLEVDFESGYYKDYVWFFGFKNGPKQRFERLDYIFIKQIKVSQNLNSLISTNTISKKAFDGYLKIDGEPIHLLTNENKSDLTSRLRKIAEELELKLVDYSTED